MASYDSWKSLTISSLIPALDSTDINSVISEAKSTIDDNFTKVAGQFGNLSTYMTALSALKSQILEAQSAVDNLISAITGSGFYTTVIHNAVGSTSFRAEITAALADSGAPEINDSTVVGAVMLLATGATTSEVETVISNVKQILSGLS